MSQGSSARPSFTADTSRIGTAHCRMISSAEQSLEFHHHNGHYHPLPLPPPHHHQCSTGQSRREYSPQIWSAPPPPSPPVSPPLIKESNSFPPFYSITTIVTITSADKKTRLSKMQFPSKPHLIVLFTFHFEIIIKSISSMTIALSLCSRLLGLLSSSYSRLGTSTSASTLLFHPSLPDSPQKIISFKTIKNLPSS